MKTILVHKQIGYLTLLTVLFVLLAGCSLPIIQTPEDPVETVSEPTIPSIQFYLTADKIPIQVERADGSTSELGEGEAVAISINDRILVEGGGLGKLLYSDRINVEILQNTELVLSKITEVTGNRIEATFDLAAGHVHIRTGEGGRADVILKTNDATITTLIDDTDFSVCYAPGPDGLTCHPVTRGSIKVFGVGGTQVYDGPSGGYTFNGQGPQPPICFHEEEYKDWLSQMRNGEDVPALGALVDQWYKTSCSGEPLVETPNPEETQVESPTETLEATETFEPPTLPYVMITNITINEHQQYVVEYETYGYTEQLPGQHVHFFFDTVPPDQAGVPGAGPWKLYGGPRPFIFYSINLKPAEATQLCALVANSDHSIQEDTGNCFELP